MLSPKEPQKPAPEDDTLRLSVPKMARTQDDTMLSTGDEAALKENAGCLSGLYRPSSVSGD